jgi:hypothetical protein
MFLTSGVDFIGELFYNVIMKGGRYMTLQTLVDDIMIQGDVLVRLFNDNSDEDDIVIETNDIEGEDFSDYAEYEVVSVYANLEQLVIEIQEND